MTPGKMPLPTLLRAPMTEREIDALACFLIHADSVADHNDREICLAADLVYGWGPGASDWEEAKTPSLEVLHRLLSGDA